jgi:hypothetical protein
MRPKRRDPENLETASKPRTKRSTVQCVIRPAQPWVAAYETTLADLNGVIADATALRELSRWCAYHQAQLQAADDSRHS